MTTLREYDNPSRVKELLAEHLKAGQLALLIGSGLSVGLGLPTWEELIKRLYDSDDEPMPTHINDLPLLAELYEEKFFRGDRAGFMRRVRKILYPNGPVPFRELRTSDLLSSFGALVMASRRGSAAVITFNYDDLLERYLMFHGFDIVSVGTPRSWDSRGDVKILHPHGFLSNEGDVVQPDQIVITRADYNRITGKDSDLWRQTTFGLMRSHFCVFVGLGHRDVAVDSIIHDVKAVHPAMVDRPFWAISFTTADSDVDEPLWNARGVLRQKIGDYGSALAEFLFDICQKAAKR